MGILNLFSRKKEKIPDINSTKVFFESNRDIRRENFLRCPEWMEPDYDEDGNYVETPDELFLLFDPFLQRKFYKKGQVAVGALVQANSLLFEKGIDNCPANYVYSTDPYYMEYPGNLLDIAQALFQIKGDEGFYSSIQRLVDSMENEEERIFAYKLPRHVTGGRAVYFTTLVVDREHLPQKRIVEPVVPLLVLENNKPDAMILPHWYWQE